jgi:hypothetical protein
MKYRKGINAIKIQRIFVHTFRLVSLIISIGITNEKTIMIMKRNNELVFPYE